MRREKQCFVIVLSLMVLLQAFISTSAYALDIEKNIQIAGFADFDMREFNPYDMISINDGERKDYEKFLPKEIRVITEQGNTTEIPCMWHCNADIASDNGDFYILDFEPEDGYAISAKLEEEMENGDIVLPFITLSVAREDINNQTYKEGESEYHLKSIRNRWVDMTDYELNQYFEHNNMSEIARFIYGMDYDDRELLLEKNTVLNNLTTADSDNQKKEMTYFEYITKEIPEIRTLASNEYTSTTGYCYYAFKDIDCKKYVKYKVDFSITSGSNCLADESRFKISKTQMSSKPDGYTIDPDFFDVSISYHPAYRKQFKDSDGSTYYRGLMKRGNTASLNESSDGGLTSAVRDGVRVYPTASLVTFVIKIKYKKPAYTYAATSISNDIADATATNTPARFNLREYNWQNTGDTTLDKGVYHTAVTDELTGNINSRAVGITTTMSTQKTKSTTHASMTIVNSHPDLTVQYNKNSSSAVVSKTENNIKGTSPVEHSFRYDSDKHKLWYVTSTCGFSNKGYEIDSAKGWYYRNAQDEKVLFSCASGSGYKGSAILDFKDGDYFTSKSKNMYANWQAKSLTIKYKPNGGSFETDSYGVNADGVIVKKEGSIVTSEVKYNASSVDMYNVHTGTYGFMLKKKGYHTDAQDAWRFANTTVTLPSSSTSASDDLNKLKKYMDDDKTTATLVVNWKPNRFTVKYDGNGADSGSMSNTEHIYGETRNLRMNSFTKKGYRFIGWATSPEGKNLIPDMSPVENLSSVNGGIVTLYAQWEAENANYKVQHWQQKKGADPTSKNSVNYSLKETAVLSGKTGASVTPAVKMYEGFTSPQKKTAEIKADGSLVVNYYYPRKKYTVSVNKGTGIDTVSVENEKPSYEFGSIVTISAKTSQGYKWLNWSGTSDSVNARYSFTMPASNVSERANAELIQYSITYNLNGGKLSKTNPVKYNVTTADFLLNNPEKTGYDFIGWTGSNGNIPDTAVHIKKGSTGNKTYTANWVEEKQFRPPAIEMIVSQKDGNKLKPFFLELDGKRQLTLQEGDRFSPLYYQKAVDKQKNQDAKDISSRTVVKENKVPIDNGLLKRAGLFTIKYYVENEYKLSAEHTGYVRVNKAPVIKEIPDRVFCIDQPVDEKELFEKIVVEDMEDGDIRFDNTKESKIYAIDENGEKSEVSQIDTAIPASKYIVWVKYEDSMKGVVTGEFNVNVEEEVEVSDLKKYPRFINKEMLNTLKSESIWIKEPEYSRVLMESLNRETDNPLYSYELFN